MAHSKLFSPSAAKRWLTCWASAQLNADKERKSNPDADRGTVLHEWMQKNLNAETPDFTTIPAGDVADAKVALAAAKLALEDFPDALLLEQEVVLHGMPEIFGTVDLIAYNELEEHLLILDYKFGYGEVEVEMNPQLMIYALGSMAVLPIKVKTVTMCVVQPQRSKNPQFFTMKAAELDYWVETDLEPAYQAIKDGSTSFKIDDDACKWCPSKLTCPARSQEIEDLMFAVPAPPVGKEPSVFDKLEMVARMRDWCNSVEAEAEARLLAGEKDPRWKLVRGKANRKWRDPVAAERWLAARGLKEKERYNWTVIGIPAAEGLVESLIKDSKKLQTAFAALIEKPEGKITYAKAGDKRAAVEVAAVEELMKEFDDDLDNL